MNRITVREDAFLFFYDDKSHIAKEHWAPGMHFVPQTNGIWQVNHGFPAQARHLFLSHSAADILCFCQLRPEWLRNPGSVAFAALGLLATIGQINFLKESFANAKVHTLFDGGLTGRVTDCKVALWQTGKNAGFKIKDDLVKVTYRNRQFCIPIAIFSLNRFELTIAIRSKIITHKPKSCLGSYHDFFVKAITKYINKHTLVPTDQGALLCTKSRFCNPNYQQKNEHYKELL